MTTTGWIVLGIVVLIFLRVVIGRVIECIVMSTVKPEMEPVKEAGICARCVGLEGSLCDDCRESTIRSFREPSGGLLTRPAYYPHWKYNGEKDCFYCKNLWQLHGDDKSPDDYETCRDCVTDSEHPNWEYNSEKYR